jgi:hypothetical protein
MKFEEAEPVIVFEGDDWEAAMVKSLLQNAEIETFLRDTRMGVLAPWNVTAGGAGPVKVIVSSLDFERAREVVAQYEQAERNNK